MECERCLKKVKVLYRFPFLFMMGGKYRQYYGCYRCVQEEVEFANSENGYNEPIKKTMKRLKK